MSDKKKPKLNMIERALVEQMLSMVAKKAIPSLVDQADEIAAMDKTIVLTMKKVGTKNIPVAYVYKTSEVFAIDSPLSKVKNIAVDENGDQMVQRLDDGEQLVSFFSKFLE